MYKLLLVDDEEEERKGILNKIEWGKYGFEVVGEAENGMEALEMADKVVIDIVITDIRMPFMDGLTLCQKLREKYPNIKVIILTGYDQFEYAQKAIKLDVVEYVLKPISSKELIEVLINIKNKMDEEIANRKNIEILKEYYLRSLPILRQAFLSSLVSNKMSNDEIKEKLKTYDIKLEGKVFGVALLKIKFSKIEDIYTFLDRKDEDRNSGTKDSELIKLGIFNLCKEIVDKHDKGIVFINEDYIVFILSIDDEDCIFMNKILPVLEEIRQSIKKFYGISCTIGIGSFFKELDLISNSYKEAVSAISYASILDDKIIYIQDVEPKNIKKLVFDQLKERRLFNAIKTGTKSELIETIDCLFREIIELNISYKNYYIYIMEIVNTILKAIQDLNIDIDEIMDINYDMLIEILKLKDIKEVKRWIIDICLKIKSYIVKERQNSYKKIVQAAISYIHENYRDSELSIDKLCKVLYISPAYFSTIFKKETKHTFVNYLTHVRMEAAKELLRTTNLKTLEIAKMVGYSEPNYFSYCFKKKFNISPSEYRNSL
ncbi:response regulator [Caloramator sp. E03]|uniref:response regulator n=1 Tax=Caloramator sp. E03 TaxID=2576307 RepID=UPI001110F173|nr:response regulator [Caloramator sp. E03]QCX34011.1 response regulator [Caloramator sp. E03]